METDPEAEGSQFTTIRLLNASKPLVWEAWTQAHRLAAWWGPKGVRMRVVALDLRPGGTFHYALATPDGRELFGKFTYLEISQPDRLVFVSSFSDAEGNCVRAPFSQQWPLEVRNVMTLTEDGARTTLTLRADPIRAAEAERHLFSSFHASMAQGFAGTFDQLDAHLAGQ